MKGTLIVFVLISLFFGFVLGGTAIGNIFPSTFKITDPLLCDGEMSITARYYSYEPGRQGRENNVICTDPASGESRRITGTVFAVYSLMWSALVFILLCINWLIRRWRRKAQGLSPEEPLHMPAPVSQQAASVSGNTPLEALTKLKQLRDADLITEDDYLAKKAEILARM